MNVEIGYEPHIYSFDESSRLLSDANRLIAVNFSVRPILAADSARRRTSMDRS
jgi:hypothetical protein